MKSGSAEHKTVIEVTISTSQLDPDKKLIDKFLDDLISMAEKSLTGYSVEVFCEQAHRVRKSMSLGV